MRGSVGRFLFIGGGAGRQRLPIVRQQCAVAVIAKRPHRAAVRASSSHARGKRHIASGVSRCRAQVAPLRSAPHTLPLPWLSGPQSLHSCGPDCPTLRFKTEAKDTPRITRPVPLPFWGGQGGAERHKQTAETATADTQGRRAGHAMARKTSDSQGR